MIARNLYICTGWASDASSTTEPGRKPARTGVYDTICISSGPAAFVVTSTHSRCRLVKVIRLQMLAASKLLQQVNMFELQRRPRPKLRDVRSKPLPRPRGGEKLRTKPLFRFRGGTLQAPNPKSNGTPRTFSETLMLAPAASGGWSIFRIGSNIEADKKNSNYSPPTPEYNTHRQARPAQRMF
jgi:hypothetical protein